MGCCNIETIILIAKISIRALVVHRKSAVWFGRYMQGIDQLFSWFFCTPWLCNVKLMLAGGVLACGFFFCFFILCLVLLLHGVVICWKWFPTIFLFYNMAFVPTVFLISVNCQCCIVFEVWDGTGRILCYIYSIPILFEFRDALIQFLLTP